MNWLTTSDLKEYHGVSRKLASSWFPTFAILGLARRISEKPRAPMLFSSWVVDFLFKRREQYGKPPWESKRGYVEKWYKAAYPHRSLPTTQMKELERRQPHVSEGHHQGNA